MSVQENKYYWMKIGVSLCIFIVSLVVSKLIGSSSINFVGDFDGKNPLWTPASFIDWAQAINFLIAIWAFVYTLRGVDAILIDGNYKSRMDEDGYIDYGIISKTGRPMHPPTEISHNNDLGYGVLTIIYTLPTLLGAVYMLRYPYLAIKTISFKILPSISFFAITVLYWILVFLMFYLYKLLHSKKEV
jgi:hypothetical protein